MAYTGSVSNREPSKGMLVIFAYLSICYVAAHKELCVGWWWNKTCRYIYINKNYILSSVEKRKKSTMAYFIYLFFVMLPVKGQCCEHKTHACLAVCTC